jgi:hypothetical protein
MRIEASRRDERGGVEVPVAHRHRVTLRLLQLGLGQSVLHGAAENHGLRFLRFEHRAPLKSKVFCMMLLYVVFVSQSTFQLDGVKFHPNRDGAHTQHRAKSE